MFATLCLLALMMVATVTDVWQRKIFNWTTYSGIVLALILAGAATMLNRSEISEIGIMQSVFGLLACGAIMLVCFVLFQVGGGDVKLLAMMGAFLGPESGIESLLWTFVLAGATAVIILIWKVGFFRITNRVIQQLKCKLGFGKWDSLSPEEKTQLQMDWFLAPAALVAVLVVTLPNINWLYSATLWVLV